MPDTCRGRRAATIENEDRRQMVDRGKLFGVPTYGWLPARSTRRAEYSVQTGETLNVER